MDVRQLKQIFNIAASSSLILLGSTAVLAGNHSYEQPTRPHMSAACSPNWGFNQTCWSRFPPVQGCPGTSRDRMSDGAENHPSQQLLYTPQNSLLLPDSQILSPAYGAPQAPISVFPNAAPDAAAGGMPAMPFPNGFPSSTTQPQQLAPLRDPSIPDASFVPGLPGPGASSTLPPLPAPPLGAPGQSSWQPNIIGPNRQMVALPISTSRSAFQTGSRYGNFEQSVFPEATTALMSPVSFTSALVPNARSMPMQGQTQQAHRHSSQPPATSSVGSRYGNAGRVQPTQLPPVAFYPTFHAEPFRRAP